MLLSVVRLLFYSNEKQKMKQKMFPNEVLHYIQILCRKMKTS